jgi:AAA+ superfamily predicted ATPase
MRNGTIEIKLPFSFKWGILDIPFKRTIGFSFDQLSMFRLLQNNKIDLPTHSNWLKKTPKSIIASEQIFAAAESYCMERRIKNNFTKQELSKALVEAEEEATQKIIDCYMQSEQLGQRKMPGKGKKKVNR